MLVAFATTAFAQTDETEIRQTFDDYFKISVAKDIDATLDYMYPRLYELYPRTAMKEALQEVYNDTDLTMNFANYKLISLSKTLKVGEGKYVLANYSFNLLMQHTDKSNVGQTVKNDLYMLSTLRNTYGEKNVMLDEANRLFTITVNSSMFAISEPGFTGWKLIENKKGMKNALEKLLPKEVVKKLL